MTGLAAQGQAKEIALEAQIIRADGSVEPLGTVAYWHRNPLRRLVARLRGRGRITFHSTARS